MKLIDDLLKVTNTGFNGGYGLSEAVDKLVKSQLYTDETEGDGVVYEISKVGLNIKPYKLTSGMTFTFMPSVTNTTEEVMIKLPDGSIAPLVKPDGDLQVGELIPMSPYNVVVTSTGIVLSGGGSTTPSVPTPIGTILDIFGDNSGMALYEFNNTPYDTGGIYNGVWVNSPSYSVYQNSMAADFSGGSAIDLISHDLSGVKTISFGFKAYNSNNWDVLLGSKVVAGSYNNIKLAVYQNKLTTYTYSGDKEVSSAFITDGTWHHVVITESVAGYYDYYLDGVLASSSVQDDNSSLDIAFIGADNYNGVPETMESLTGSMTLVRFLNRSINPTEADTLYQEFLGL